MDNECEKCESICGEERCQLPEGHRGKHRQGGCSWTDAGAARINAELAEAKQQN